jgi:hypothetical protein
MEGVVTTEDHVPTAKEELNRKAFETLEGLLLARDQEKINDDQLDVAVDAIFGCVGGLAETPLLEVISEIKLQTKRTYKERHLLVRAETLYLIERVIGAGKVIVNMAIQPFTGTWQKTQVKDYSEAVVPTLAAQRGVARLIKMLLEKGFVEV